MGDRPPEPRADQRGHPVAQPHLLLFKPSPVNAGPHANGCPAVRPSCSQQHSSWSLVRNGPCSREAPKGSKAHITNSAWH